LQSASTDSAEQLSVEELQDLTLLIEKVEHLAVDFELTKEFRDRFQQALMSVTNNLSDFAGSR
jgi:hypothetical protein